MWWHELIQYKLVLLYLVNLLRLAKIVCYIKKERMVVVEVVPLFY